MNKNIWETEPKNNKFVLWIILIILILIVFSLTTYFYLRHNKISQEDLILGEKFQIEEGEKIKFQIEEGEYHILSVDSIDADYVTISIQSQKTTLTLKIGEEKNIDVNKDGLLDLYIKLEKIENGKPIFMIKKITSTENNNIPNNIKDIQNNQTDIELNQPEINNQDQSEENNQVKEKNCSNQGGMICESDEKCEGAITYSTDSSNCCLGNCKKIKIPEGNIIASGEIKVSGIGTNNKLYEANCFGMFQGQVTGESQLFDQHQILYFDLENTFSETFGEDYFNRIEYELYIDGNKVNMLEYSSYGQLRRLTEDSSMDYEIPNGNNQVFINFKKSVAGKTIKIIIDPENKIIQEPVFIEKTFPEDKMDIYYDSMRYDDTLETIMISIRRDKKINECPAFMSEVYLDGVRYYGASFNGFFFDDEMKASIWGPENLSPGSYEVRVVIDSTNLIDESNETNNEIIETLIIS